jgi:nitrate/nitrite transport system permease protein
MQTMIHRFNPFAGPWGLTQLKAGGARAWRSSLLPMLGILAFLLVWQMVASQVQTSLGNLPGPIATGKQLVALYQEHSAEREKRDAFYARQAERNAQKLAADPQAEVKIRPYTGRDTFFDQILTSLVTVATGFGIAVLIAIPAGILLGLNQTLYQAINPVVQILKPISPLAWLPLVTMVVSAVYVSPDPALAKSFSTRLTFCRSGSILATPTMVLSRVGHRLHRLTVKAEMTNMLIPRIEDSDTFRLSMLIFRLR